MYFFDLEDYTYLYGCSTLPSSWETFKNYLDNIHKNYSENFIDWYESNNEVIKTFDEECIKNISEKYGVWTSINKATSNRIATLINELETSTTYGCDFDNTYYLDYVKNSEDKINIANEITLLITTGCNLKGSNNDLSIDITNLTTKSKTEKCSGAYIKQINYGSEFIGSVTIMKKDSYYE